MNTKQKICSKDKRSQREKFEDLAREAGCEDDEAVFDEKLKRIASARSEKSAEQKEKPATKKTKTRR